MRKLHLFLFSMPFTEGVCLRTLFSIKEIYLYVILEQLHVQ